MPCKRDEVPYVRYSLWATEGTVMVRNFDKNYVLIGCVNSCTIFDTVYTVKIVKSMTFGVKLSSTVESIKKYIQCKYNH